MGCGASVPKPATEEQMMTLCAMMSKEMMLLCVDRGLKQADKVKVQAPPEVAKMRESVESLRTHAKNAKGAILGDAPAADAAPAAAEAAPAPAAGGGMLSAGMGMIGGVMQKGADAAGKVAETALTTAAGGAASAVEQVLNGLADSLEKAVDTIEEPFTTIGNDTVGAKGDKIKSILDYYIANLPMATAGVAIKLTRGDAPYGPDEYAKVPSDALVDYLCRKSASNISRQIDPIVEEYIKDHKITKNWTSAIETYNGLVAKIEGIDFCKKNDIVLKPVELNLQDYIVAQIGEELTKVMGTIEKDIRASPATSGRARNPETFDAVFSGNPLTEVTFKNKDR